MEETAEAQEDDIQDTREVGGGDRRRQERAVRRSLRRSSGGL